MITNRAPERFDDDYQYFLEVTQTPERNDKHAQIIENLLMLKEGDRVLDAPCGIGRIAIRLAAKGANVSGIDANPVYIETAQKNAVKQGIKIDYQNADMRALPWENEFKAIVCWFISFGYFDELTDKNILKQFFKVLKPGGKLLIEHVYLPGYLRSLPVNGEIFSQLSKGKDIMVTKTWFDAIHSRNIVNRTVNRDRKNVQMNFNVRFFMPQELHEWLIEAGFSSVKIVSKNGSSTIPLDADRMIIIAEKESL